MIRERGILKQYICFNEEIMIKIDTKFAKLAISYLESPSNRILDEMVGLSATEHIYYHCTRYNPDPNLKFNNKYDFLKTILNDKQLEKNICNYKKLVNEIDNYADLDSEIENEALRSLPKGILFSSNMYITLGYFSTGSVDGKGNFNVDLTLNFEDIKEFIYNSIHELHHVGYSKFKKMPVSSISDIKTNGDMLNLMTYLLHSEGLATYAPYYKMKSENRLHGIEYEDVNNYELMSKYRDKFMEDYKQLADYKLESLSTDDLMNNYLIPLDKNKLLYKLGLYTCLKIEEQYGKEKLINTINQPITEFIEMLNEL